MCGIVGVINFNKAISISKDTLLSYTKKLKLRGPDNQNCYYSNNVGLGHARLSIIDLETGDQPLISCDNKIVVVFNGEIYNFKELRNELSVSHKFRTKTDTEVLIHGYEEWGIEKLLDKIDGQFAFAIYDKNTDAVYIARDRFGEKPLYYTQIKDELFFASELKAIDDVIIKDPLSKEGLNLFLSLSYIPAPYTIFKNVFKLDAAHYLTISKNNNLVKTCYYNLKDHINYDIKLTFEQSKDKLIELIDESIKQKMVADVPSGAFLSGGIDSSVVVGLMSKYSTEPINTFTIGFKMKAFDESDRAQIVANKYKTNHTVHYLDFDDVVNNIDNIIDYFDEPYGDSSALPSHYVAQLARKEGVPVILTGDAGDELFGGYEKYMAHYYAQKWRKIPSWLQFVIKKTVGVIPIIPANRSILRKINKVIDFSDYSDFDLIYSYLCLGFSDEERRNLIKEEFWSDAKTILAPRYNKNGGDDILNKNMIGDIHTVLEGDMFPKGDRCGMMNMVEERIPFLSRDIVEFAASLPSEYKITGKSKKYILKEAYKDFLPPKTTKFKKRGFGVPIEFWFRGVLKDELLNLANKELLIKQGIFDADYINTMILEHISGKKNYRGKIWNFYVFQKWYLKNLDN